MHILLQVLFFLEQIRVKITRISFDYQIEKYECPHSKQNVLVLTDVILISVPITIALLNNCNQPTKKKSE